MSLPSDLRAMTADDAPWAAGLMERRRQAYAGYSPVFWRPRPGVTGLHARFLGRQVASPGYVALRTDRGFLIGQRRGQEGFVDDFAVDETARWDRDGAALLLAAWQRWEADGLDAARVVTAHADQDKCALLAALSLDLAEQWWVRELPPAPPAAPAGLRSRRAGPARQRPCGRRRAARPRAGGGRAGRRAPHRARPARFRPLGTSGQLPGLDRRLRLVPGPPRPITQAQGFKRRPEVVTLDDVYDYDVLVIGSGPGGQKAAIAAAKLDRRVAIVERKDMIGGVCLNTGTIPSKTLREAIMYLTGLNQREMYGQSYHVKDEITIGDLAARTTHVVSREMDVVRSQLSRNRVTILSGTGSFTDPHTVEVDDGGGRIRTATADKIVIATGTRPARPASVEFDERTIIDSDGIVNLESVPRSMLVAGAGVIGIEYASMFAALGTKVTVVEQRERMLEFCDVEVVEALKYHLRDLAVTFRFGETVASVEARPEGAIATLLSGKKIPADTVMYSAGRQGASDHLNLEAAGLTADKRGRITVGGWYQTEVPHIYAVGDVIGFPALAATSMEQGRVAAHHACGEQLHEVSELQPIGIYSIPEISFVGRTEEQLTKDNVPFEVGVSRYRELARGQIIGDSYGVLKLLVSLDDHRLLGVHVFGTGATELIHIGQSVMGCGGTVDYLVDAVFNYPTLAEAYKVAALDAMNKMRQIARFA